MQRQHIDTRQNAEEQLAARNLSFVGVNDLHFKHLLVAQYVNFENCF